MKCKKCGKPIKEDTDGDLKYCQGHSIFENPMGKDAVMGYFNNPMGENAVIGK
jgi:hypothetical protein